MSEEELKRADVEIGEVTIIEYRKNQIVRLAECAAFLGIAGVVIANRKKLHPLVTISIVGVGIGFAAYNGYNFHKNWRQDGKLIRQAIRNKKADEKRIREEILSNNKEKEKPSNHHHNGNGIVDKADLIKSENKNNNNTINEEKLSSSSDMNKSPQENIHNEIPVDEKELNPIPSENKNGETIG